jgi:hypothetical protein
VRKLNLKAKLVNHGAALFFDFHKPCGEKKLLKYRMTPH